MNAIVDRLGWVEIGQGITPGKYQKYLTLMCVIVHCAKPGSKSHNITVYFPPKVVAALGNPRRVKFYMRGSNVGMCSTDSGGYAVQIGAVGNGTGHRTMPFCNATGALRQLSIKSGAYTSHVEANGMVVFDSADTPSQ